MHTKKFGHTCFFTKKKKNSVKIYSILIWITENIVDKKVFDL